MENNGRMARLVAKANASYENYSGKVGGQRDQFIGNEKFMNMSGGSGHVDFTPKIQDLVIRITQTDNVNTLFAPLFSAFEEFEPAFNGAVDYNNGNTAGVGVGLAVEYVNYSQKEVRNMIIGNGWTLNGYRYDFTDLAQAKGDWDVRTKEFEKISNEPHRPSHVQDLSNLISTRLDNSDFFLEVNGGTTLGIEMAPSASRVVEIAFRIGTALNKGNALKGKSAVTKFGAGAVQSNQRIF